MAYRFTLQDNSVQAAVRRIAGEQIGKALQSLETLGADEAVHDVRKRCKKLRALLRLVRPALKDYRAENAAFRDIAGSVSGARDAKVLVETCDRLLADFGDAADRESLAAVRDHLAKEWAASRGVDGDPALAAVAERLRAAERRAGAWRLDGDGWDAIGPGLSRCRRQALKSARQARAETEPQAIHELRKPLKYHWYHLRLVTDLWPEAMAVQEALAARAAEALGLHHDLWVLDCRLERDAALAKVAAPVRALAAREREKLESEAWPMLDRLLAEAPDALASHWGRLWAVWRGDAPAGGR